LIKTWIKNRLGIDFFSLHGYFGPRTTNAAESYHGHQHRIYRTKNMQLGEWLVTFREVSCAEEDEAWDIYTGQEEPELRDNGTGEVTARFLEMQNNLRDFLSQNPDDDAYHNEMTRYLSRTGRLLGIKPRELRDQNNSINN